MAFTKANKAEQAKLQKEIAALREKLKPLEERGYILSYASMENLSPEKFLETKREPMLKTLVPFKRAAQVLISAGFVLDTKAYDYKKPRFEDTTVWDFCDFFGNQNFIRPIGKTGAYVQVTMDVPCGNSKRKDEDYLAFDISVSSNGYRSETKLTAAQWDVLSGAESYQRYFTTFKKFERYLNTMIEAVDSLTIPRKYK